MDQEQIEKVKLSIQNLEDKTSRVYFFVHDTKGNTKPLSSTFMTWH